MVAIAESVTIIIPRTWTDKLRCRLIVRLLGHAEAVAVVVVVVMMMFDKKK